MRQTVLGAIMNLFIKSISTLSLLLYLSSCGGSSDKSPPEINVEQPPLVVATPTETTGVITGFGSVFINGVEYETDSTVVSTDDDDHASESDLHVGMVVSLSGELDADGKTGSATSIHYDEQIKGPLESIDLAANSLVILGQIIIFDDLTSLDNVVLAELIPSDFLEVSGFYDAEGQLYATRIEKEDGISTLKLEGVIKSIDTVDKTFILGSLNIDYGLAQFDGFTEADLMDGIKVRVKGDLPSLNNNTFVISDIKLKDNSGEEGHDEGDQRHIEGIISEFESSASFVVNDIHVVTTSDTEFEHSSVDSLTLNIRVKIKGDYDANGSLVASEIRIHQRTNLKLEGVVQAIDIDASTVTVLDVTFEVNEQTKMKDESDKDERFFDLTDLVVGDFIEIKGFIDSSGRKIATKLERENEDADETTELKGLVSDIADFSFVIVDVRVLTNLDTMFEGVDGDSVNQATFFEQLEDGMLLEVEGAIIDGEFIAHQVEIEDGDDGDDEHYRTEFRGIVEEVLEVSLIVSSHHVLITDMTEFEVNDEDASAEQFWLLVNVGDQIKIKGIKDDGGNITAHSLDLELGHHEDAAEIKIWGAPFYSQDILEVSEHVVSFDQHTDFDGEGDELTYEEFIADIGNWSGVEVKGVLRDDIIYARKIELSDDEDKFGQIKLEARVEGIDDSSIIIVGHTAIFNENTEFELNGQEVNLTEFLSHLSVGSKIELEGILEFSSNDDGTLSEKILVREIEIG